MSRRGVHCGSTAMRDALARRGLALEESTVFGLGAGCGFSLHDGAHRFFVGRSATFERDLCEATGCTLNEELFEDAQQAWARCKELLDRGEKPLVYTDLLHLPYLEAHAHWHGHLITLVGYEGRDVFVEDNERDQNQIVALDDLLQALGTGMPVKSDSACVVLGVEGAPRMPEHVEPAILRNALQMLEAMPELEQLARELPSWSDKSLRLAWQVIEVRGSGGGLFRKLYAEFCTKFCTKLGPHAGKAAAQWTELAKAIEAARSFATPRTKLVAEQVKLCVEAEHALWETARSLCE